MITKKYDINLKDEQAVLTKKLYDASNLYYNSGKTMMSDSEFDKELEHLKNLETESGFVYDISPTVKVGAEIVDYLEKSTHEQPALSLDKIKYKNKEDIVDWLGNKEGLLSWKMDGLTVVLTYDDGRLEKAVTRGNGETGSVVTHNARFFEGIPLTIPYDGHVVVRGECTMTNEEFERVNAEAGGIYENARNLASSTIQMLDANESRKRKIVFSAFKLVVPEPNAELKNESDRFEWMREQGFNVVEYEKVNASNVLDVIEKWKEKIKDNQSPTDGLVFSYEDSVYAESLGTTGHHPRGSIALKWTDETVKTKVRDIEWSVGKTGAITPVAIFDTVRLGLGSNVSRASLHNLSIMKNMPSIDGDGTVNCGIDSEVNVYMANMIIPQIQSATAGKIEIPDKCPVCGGEVAVKNNDGVETLVCINPDCQAKHLKRLATFASKDGANIEGLSESKIEYLVSNGYIKNEVDFYTLKDNKESVEKLKEADGWGDKSVENLLASIEKSRDISLKNFLYSLSIPLVGHDLSKKLSLYMKNKIDNFVEYIKNPNEEMLSLEDGIGPIKAKNVCTWCREITSNPEKQELFESLLSNLKFKEEKVSAGTSLNGMTFVITGSVHTYKNRDEFKASVEARGGKVSGSVSSKTNYLVNNDVTSTSGKNKKAKELGIEIISEDDFISRFGF